ncbi:MAG TPA: hypothetical protein DIC60_00995 [Lachnospiraceae bacterium]|nr:hypothetical protein [Lachnospiraceae bacterium]
MTNKELVAFAKSKLGVPYVYGMKGAVMTLAKYNQLKTAYGSNVWNSDKNKVGKVCCDCSGLISWATGVMRGSSQYKSAAKNVYDISTIAKAPVGALVWQSGHIGIYIGIENGVPYYIAEDGSAYGCRKNKLSNAKFTHWFLCTDITYVEDKKGEEEMDKTTIKISVNGATKTLEGFNVDGTNYVTIRELCELLGVTVGYDSATKMVVLSK